MQRRVTFYGFAASAVVLVLLVGSRQFAPRASARASITAQERAVVPALTPTVPTCGVGWNIVTSPSPGGGENILWAAAAVSPSNVWAVGDYTSVPFGPFSALIEHWDGAQWSNVITPNIGSSLLSGIAARTADDIWAVGEGISGTLTLHWDGIQWTAVPSPNGPNSGNRLHAVSALTTNDVWAVGESTGSVPNWSLIEHWDGLQWSVVPSPNPGTTFNILNAVVAVTSDDVWAAGVTSNDFTVFHTLIEHWNGSTWSVVPSPSPWSSDVLWGLAATSGNSVWAVGDTGDGHGAGLTLVLRWDGTAWSRVPSPSPAADFSILKAISVAGPDDIWVAGYQNNGNGDITLTEHWDGGQWTVVPSPNAGSQGSYFFGVAASTGDAWAVGKYFAGNGFQPSLIEHDTDPCVTPSPTAPVSATPTSPGIASQTVTTVPASPPPTVLGSATPTAAASTATATAPVPPSSPTSAATAPATITTVAASPTRVQPNSTATATPVLCAVAFSDVQPTDYFYTPVRYLACHGVVSGYADGTFRPYSNTTRAQQVKLVVLGFARPLTTPAAGQYTFADVPPAFPFFAVIETAAAQGIVSGYTCGGPGEPCDPQARRYFRPYADVTRGQLAKMVVAAAGWAVLNPAAASFADVPLGSAFYAPVETAACHGIISGYSCGGAGEPCDPQRRPYFRPANQATRGQIAKIVYGAITSGGRLCSLTGSE